jgi:hypothetical protein
MKKEEFDFEKFSKEVQAGLYEKKPLLGRRPSISEKALSSPRNPG